MSAYIARNAGNRERTKASKVSTILFTSSIIYLKRSLISIIIFNRSASEQKFQFKDPAAPVPSSATVAGCVMQPSSTRRAAHQQSPVESASKRMSNFDKVFFKA